MPRREGRQLSWEGISAAVLNVRMFYFVLGEYAAVTVFSRS